MVVANLCSYEPPEGGKKCTNRIKEGALRCYLHEGKRSASESPEPLKPEEIEKRRRIIESLADTVHPKHIYLGNVENFRQSLITEFTPVSLDTLEAADKSYTAMPWNLETPSQAREAITNNGVNSFIDNMVSNGIERQRIDTMQVYGFNRMTASGTKQSADEAFHEVIVVDRDTEHEVVVDPFMAIFAPVLNQDESVDSQLPSGVTPFADLPWVGSINSYVGGDYLWWDKFRINN